MTQPWGNIPRSHSERNTAVNGTRKGLLQTNHFIRTMSMTHTPNLSMTTRSQNTKYIKNKSKRNKSVSLFSSNESQSLKPLHLQWFHINKNGVLTFIARSYHVQRLDDTGASRSSRRKSPCGPWWCNTLFWIPFITGLSDLR